MVSPILPSSVLLAPFSTASFQCLALRRDTFAAKPTLFPTRPLAQLKHCNAVPPAHAPTAAVVTLMVYVLLTLSSGLLLTPPGQCGFRDEHCKTSCVADCDAKAPCGVNSKDGSQTCPLNVCCSYFGFCGATDTFCRDSTAAGQSTPCQKQFGKCGTVTPPTCGKSSGTASRRIAYYEGW